MFGYSVINLITFFVGLGLLFNGYSLVVQGREDLMLVLLSVTLGVGLVIVAAFPDGFRAVAPLIGLKFKARAILVVSNLTLFISVAYLLNRTGELQTKVSKLNEELSLLKNVVDEQDQD